MDKELAIKALERLLSRLADREEMTGKDIYMVVKFAYTIEFIDSIQEAIEALEYMRNMGKCEGCISYECEFCTRYKNRYDMYQDRW